jgi:hypothetical protein
MAYIYVKGKEIKLSGRKTVNGAMPILYSNRAFSGKSYMSHSRRRLEKKQEAKK